MYKKILLLIVCLGIFNFSRAKEYKFDEELARKTVPEISVQQPANQIKIEAPKQKESVAVPSVPEVPNKNTNYQVFPKQFSVRIIETNSSTGAIKEKIITNIPVPVNYDNSLLIAVKVVFRVLLILALCLVLVYVGFRIYNEAQICKSMRRASEEIDKG